MAISQANAEERAKAYTDAWNSHVPDAVASFFAEDGHITINDDEPSISREQILQWWVDSMNHSPTSKYIWTVFALQERTPYVVGR